MACVFRKITMRVYFNMFWPDFMTTNPVNYNFFIRLLSSIFETDVEVSTNIQESDILVESMFGSIPLIGLKQWKYSFYYSGENYVPNNSRYTAVLGGSTQYPNCIKLPQILSYMYCGNLFTQFSRPIFQTSVPSLFACTVISNPNGKVRNKFIQRMEDCGIRIDHGGKYKNNIGHTLGGDYNSPDMLSFFGKYKFAITMENSLDTYYLTEKVCHGLQSGVIPVYWGSSHIHEYINPERILILKSDSDEDMDALIRHMVHMTADEWLEIVKKPIFSRANLLEDAIKEIKTRIV